MDLSSLLSDSLKHEGYEVEDAPPIEGRSGASYPVSLMATRQGRRLIVDVLATRSVGPKDVKALESIVEDTGVDGAILYGLAGLDPALRQNPPSERLELWPREKLATFLGSRLIDAVAAGEEGLPELELLSHVDDPPGAAPERTPEQVPEPTREPASSPTSEPTPEPAASAASEQGGQMFPEADAELLPSGQASDPVETPSPAEAKATPAEAASSDPSIPQAEPPAATGGTPDPTPGAAAETPPPPSRSPETPESTGLDEEADGGFVDPQDMAERAKRMLDAGEIPDDGDAEILSSSRKPADAPGPSSPPESSSPEPGPPSPQAPPPDGEPEAEGETGLETEGEPEPEGQAFPDGDCELLPSKPRTSEAQEARAGDQEEAASTPPPGPDRAAPSNPASSSTQPSSSTSSTPPAGSGPATKSPLAAAGATTVPAPDEPRFEAGGCIQPQVDQAAARQAAQGALFKVDEVKLELIPFHVFAYECELQGGRTSRPASGRVWVSKQSGAVVPAPEGPMIAEPSGPFTRYEGKLGPEALASNVATYLSDELEVREEVKEDYGESAIIERVTLKPVPESLAVTAVGSAYAPRWKVTGQNGTVYVDALTGDLFSV